MVGYGSGELRLNDAQSWATGLEMSMGAVGVRGTLLEPSLSQDGLALAVRSDVLWSRVDTAAVAGRMVATAADASRLRLVLEGLRHDGGDAETGSGVEVGDRIRYASSWGLSLEASARGLLAHEAQDYQEWGASGPLRFDPGRQGKGLSASITPAWGTSASGVGRLWGQPDACGLVPGDGLLAPSAAGRLDAELGYGLAALRGRGLLTPYARVALVEGNDNAWHLGARLALRQSLNLSLEASRREREGDATAHEVALRASLGW